MGWIRVSDDFYDNDKMIAAGSIGRDLYWHGMAFCNRNLTDGLIPKGRALSLVDFTGAAVLVTNYGGVDGHECAPIAVERVLDAGLWHEEGHDCPDCIQPGTRHYIVHDYLKYQPSRAEVEAKAEANRERVRRFKEKQKASNAVGNAVGNALTNAAVTRQLHDTPNPNPTPSNSPVVTSGGEGSVSNAREEPSPHCTKHPGGTDKPCRGCADARRSHEDWTAQQQQNELEHRRQLKAARDACPLCDENGLRDIGANHLARCDHPEASNA